MKVAIVTKYYLPIKGGIEVHCYYLQRYLSKFNINVTVHTSSYMPNGKKLPQDSFASEASVLRHGYFIGLFFDISDYDIIHLHNFNIFPHSIILSKVLLRRMLGKKYPRVIITTHGGFTPPWTLFPIWKRIIKKFYHITLGKLLLNNVPEYIIAVSEYEQIQLIEAGINRRKIIIIPNGIEDIAYQKIKCIKPKYPMPYVLFIGRIAPIKNIATLINYIRYVPGIYLVIVGSIQDENYFKFIKGIIRKYKLDNRVIFAGELWGRDKYCAIHNSLALALLSKSEAEPIVVKEAVTQGKIVIASNITVFDMLKNEIPGIVLVKNKEDFVKVVGDIIEKSFSREVYKRQKKVSKTWQWENIIKKIMYTYKKSIRGESYG